MEIEGTIIQVMQLITGTSAKGQWQKQEFILETAGQYPKKICMTIFGQDKISQLHPTVGDKSKVSINIESREYNGRWYTDIQAWKIIKETSSQATSPTYEEKPPHYRGSGDDWPGESGTDDLPF